MIAICLIEKYKVVMTGYHEVGHQPTPDEIFANMAVGYAALCDVYLELYPEADYENGGVMYSAMCLPQRLHDDLLAAYNERFQKDPPCLPPTEPQCIWRPADRLELGVVTSMPSYRTGFKTAAEALQASAQAYPAIPKCWG